MGWPDVRTVQGLLKQLGGCVPKADRQGCINQAVWVLWFQLVGWDLCGLIWQLSTEETALVETWQHGSCTGRAEMLCVGKALSQGTWLVAWCLPAASNALNSPPTS